MSIPRFFLWTGCLVLASAAGCKGDGEDIDEVEPEELTCDQITDPGFCWAVGVYEAYDCVDYDLAPGTFNGDRTACTYSDGVTIEFDEPLPADVFETEFLWKFTIVDPSGTQCARFVEDQLGGALTTDQGTVDQSASGFTGIDITCPDGTVYHTGNAFDLFDCGEGAVIPGYSFSGSDNVAFNFLGGPDEVFSLWNCTDPVP